MTDPVAFADSPAVTGDPVHPALGNEPEHCIRHVLVCLDRSPLSESCLPHARAVIDAFHAKVTLLHVMASPEGDQPPSRPDALDWEITRREAEEYLRRIQNEFVGRGLASDHVMTEVTQGRPPERIVTLARELGADLTVIASHGEGGVSGWNLGSTAQQVLALAPGSVLVVPPDSGSARPAPARRIVVGIDGSLRSESVLPEVAGLARFHGAAISLVHIVPDPKPTAVLSDEGDLALARSLASHLSERAKGYLSQLRERYFAQVALVETLVLQRADERRGLLDAAQNQRADLLVLAAHGVTCDPDRPFGSMTAYALSHGRLPLLVLQDLPAGERESRRPPASGELAPASVRSSGARSEET